MRPNLALIVFTFTLFHISFAHPLEEKLRFDNYTVYRIIPENKNGLKILQEWQKSQPELDFWLPVRAVGVPVDIMVSPKHKNNLEYSIGTEKLSSKILIHNVQDHIDKENPLSNASAASFAIDRYHTLDEIYNWMKELAVNHRRNVKMINVGKTYEKRDILGVKISFKNTSQKAVFIESNIHAREWISGAVNIYIINQLLTSQDATIRQVAESHDWYIVPIANPDGFDYSHTKNRLWRKTRVPYAGDCFGADPNRNWGYEWGHGGASTDPCSDTYQGPSVFSEPSTKALSNYISTIGKELVAYIDFHSYSQLLMVPYGTTKKHLDNYDDMYAVGLKAKAALAKRYGTSYEVGSIAEIVYIASGSSVDWVKGNYHTPIAFAYELRDTGFYGFLLPANLIIPTGEETLDSLLTILVEGEKTIKH